MAYTCRVLISAFNAAVVAIAFVASFSCSVAAFGVEHHRHQPSAVWKHTRIRGGSRLDSNYISPRPFAQSIHCASTTSPTRHSDAITSRRSTVSLSMVRNIDLPEALVFYGMESIIQPSVDCTNDDTKQATTLILRPGIARLLKECQEVGTSALILSETESIDEGSLKQRFLDAWEHSFIESSKNSGKSQSSTTGGNIKELMSDDTPVINFRCLSSTFTTPPSSINKEEEESAEFIDDPFYNLQRNGKSPSPAFLLDSLNSVVVDPRGFGGSSGFARGQWIEPRRSPLPARTVVFIAGDWSIGEQDKVSTDDISWLINAQEEDTEQPTVQDRCAASRAAGCRIIYLEQSTDDSQRQQHITVKENTNTMSLCDAVLMSYGNDNPRDLQPVTLDAISTPGEYWLNPPMSRDDEGNNVSPDDVVKWFRAERKMEEIVGDAECTVVGDAVVEEEDQLSDEEIEKILADLDVI